MSKKEQNEIVGAAFRRLKAAQKQEQCLRSKLGRISRDYQRIKAHVGIDNAGRLASAGTTDGNENMVRSSPIQHYPTYEDLKAAVQGREAARTRMLEARDLWLPHAP
jgi:hypothetical protein